WAPLSREEYLQAWSKWPTARRLEALKTIGVEQPQERLLDEDPGNLPAADQEIIWRTYWEPAQNDRVARLKNIGVDENQANAIAASAGPIDYESDPKTAELLWRTRVYKILHSVSPAVASIASGEDKELDNRGILSLVVRTEGVTPEQR